MSSLKARTVTGDVEHNDLGVTYCHEHLILDSPVIESDFPELHLPSIEDAVAELATDLFVGTMVDAMPEGGRHIDRLIEVSKGSGVHIISATGLHTAKYYRGHPWALTDDSEQLSARFVADIENLCGVIKFASGADGFDRRTGEVLDAVANAHRATGAPIITHCEDGRLGAEQVERLANHGVDLARVVLSHTDKVLDLGYHRSLLETGVNLEYDQALRHFDDPAQPTAALLADMIEAGFADQLMLGTDGARRSLWKTLGGEPGLSYLGNEYQTVLGRFGITREIRRRIMIDNPARWLAFVS